MDEHEFVAAADTQLSLIEAALDRVSDAGEVDIDIEIKPGGVIEVECVNGSKIIVNRHVAAQEIWLAAKSGGFHFRYQDGRWINTRDGEELMAALSRTLGEQAGVKVSL